MTKHDVATLAMAGVVAGAVLLMPAQTLPAGCYWTKAGIVCPRPARHQDGGSGITPVKRFRPGA